MILILLAIATAGLILSGLMVYANEMLKRDCSQEYGDDDS